MRQYETGGSQEGRGWRGGFAPAEVIVDVVVLQQRALGRLLAVRRKGARHERCGDGDGGATEHDAARGGAMHREGGQRAQQGKPRHGPGEQACGRRRRGGGGARKRAGSGHGDGDRHLAGSQDSWQGRSDDQQWLRMVFKPRCCMRVL